MLYIVGCHLVKFEIKTPFVHGEIKKTSFVNGKIEPNDIV
jgi:hypothetical protein